MKQLTILVDMDDTIEDLLGAWLSFLNNKYGTNVKRDDVREWDISKAFPTLERKQVYEPLTINEFWGTIKPIEGAYDTLKNLMEDGHSIYIVTASAYETLPAKMELTLFRNFPFIKWSNVIITSNKQMVKGDVLIDDGVHNHEGGDYISILMNAPHNVSFQKDGVIRVHSWNEIYEVIREIAEGR